MAKTLAQLMRDATECDLYIEMICYAGSEDVPDELKGVRQIVGKNSTSIFLCDKEGKGSVLTIKRASLVEYTDKHIILYSPIQRDLTPDEETVLAEWELRRDREQEKIDALTEGATSYWQKYDFLRGCGYKYLVEGMQAKGFEYDSESKKVLDFHIKGDAIMKYRILRP